MLKNVPSYSKPTMITQFTVVLGALNLFLNFSLSKLNSLFPSFNRRTLCTIPILLVVTTLVAQRER